MIEISRYEVQEGVSEYHVMIHVDNPRLTYAEQVESVLSAYTQLLEGELNGAVAVFKRFFLSDAANQSDYLQTLLMGQKACPLSMVEQPPLNGTKIALWVYLQKGVALKALSHGMYEVKHGAYRHLWMAGACHGASDAEAQTRQLFDDYITQLQEQGCTLADHCLRTWFFVQNVDVNYAGVVKARNEVFATQNLTNQTHFIASTGIAGRHANHRVSVLMDAYAVQGICQEQIRYLYAPTHLNPTYEYGVSFERGTAVDYGDRRQVFISGTASINNKGEVVHPGDIRKQTLRMWKNVEVLLAEAECTFEHVSHLLVYLRDVADYTIVKEMFDERFPNLPKVYLLAPVCRPGWLIEMECIAICK
jgi:enamine deaminase RidA (YjgF/YER057c/UK114 family)